MGQKFKVTYATITADNEELQSAYDLAIDQVKADWLGAEVPMFIHGQQFYADEKFESYSPIDTDIHLCTAQKGTIAHAKKAIPQRVRAAASATSPPR